MAELSERGFEQYGEVETKYGHTIRVYESSSASGPHVWMQTRQSPESGAPHGMGPEEATAHLDLVQAMRVRKLLDEFIEGVPERWGNGARFYWEAKREVDGTPLPEGMEDEEPDEEDEGCLFCGHDEERHTKTDPEEGYRDLCSECQGPDSLHAYDLEPRGGAVPSRERLAEVVRGILGPSASQERVEASVDRTLLLFTPGSVVACACGTQWPLGTMPSNHTTTQCAPLPETIL